MLKQWEKIKNYSPMSEQPAATYFSDDYRYGFSTPVETDSLPKGLSEDTIYQIWKKKNYTI